MLIKFKDLQSLSVETRSGNHLGKVCEIFLEPQSHTIAQYEVKSGRALGRRHLIAADQVIEITADKIIVSDAVITELAKEEKFKEVANKTSPALTSTNQ